jgi:hypothetical protein
MVHKKTVTKKIKVGEFFKKNDIQEIEDHFVFYISFIFNILIFPDYHNIISHLL